MSRELTIYAFLVNCGSGRKFEVDLHSIAELMDYLNSGNFSADEVLINGVSFNQEEIRKVARAFF